MNADKATPSPWFLCGDDYPDEFINGFVATLDPPPTIDHFDIRAFARKILGSISLDLLAKNRIFESLPELSQFQCLELHRTFDDERQEFIKLSKERDTIASLSAVAVVGTCALAVFRGAGIVTTEKEERMIKTMRGNKLKTHPLTRENLNAIGHRTPVTVYVYGKPFTEGLWPDSLMDDLFPADEHVERQAIIDHDLL